MAASHKKPILFRKWLTIDILFYHIIQRAVMNQEDYLYDTFVELCKHRFVMQPMQNPP